MEKMNNVTSLATTTNIYIRKSGVNQAERAIYVLQTEGGNKENNS